MEGSVDEKSILDWDQDDVSTWLASLNLSEFEPTFGDGGTLCLLDQDSLKELGVASLGKRLAILKAVYHLKVAYNVPMDNDTYIPPSEAAERPEAPTVDKLNQILQDHGQQLRQLQEENRRLQEIMHSFAEDFNTLKPQDSINRKASFKWTQFGKPQRSPTKLDIVESPHPSPSRQEHDESPGSSGPTPVAPKPQRQESSDNLKSFKVSLDDPTWKVLPAALKKYRINNDSWQNYAMFICYGLPGNRIERCLSYDEKPLLLFQRLKDAKKNPVFMLKHIKDIRSPIAVAQQKHAARKANSIIDGVEKNASPSQPQGNKSLKLQTEDLKPPGQWPDTMASPSIERRNGSEEALPRYQSDSQPHSHHHAAPVTREAPVPSNGVSYAVAIYPYMAEQEDEFDVVVGDTFVILSRARGWWVVQRDPTGTGVVETDTTKQGWVPAGCLLETSVPVASAIAEANAIRGSSPSASPPISPSTQTRKTPILPLNIISTSFPGIALMDYQKKGEEELDLVKEDTLRVFKRYNHWSYAVKEDGGDRGWVPSWYIGKIANVNGTPATPSTSTPYTNGFTSSAASSFNTGGFNSSPQGTGEAPGEPSPMSSAFPSVGSKIAVI